VALASASVALCYADRANLSTAILPMAEQYGWDSAFKGVVLSAFFAGYAATQVLGGALADRHGGKRVLAAGVALWSLFTALTPAAAAAGAFPLLAARAALGVGEGVAFPAIHALIAANVPRDRQSTAVGAATAASYAGTALAFGLAPPLITRLGWPAVFHLFGAAALVWLPLWLPVRERRRGAAAGARQSRQLLDEAAAAAASPLLGAAAAKSKPAAAAAAAAFAAASAAQQTPGPPRPPARPSALRRLWRRPEVRAIAACQYCQSYGMYGLLTWLPSFYSERYGVAMADLGGYTLAPYVLQGVVGLGAGALADRLIVAWSGDGSGDGGAWGGGGGSWGGGASFLSPSPPPPPPPPPSYSAAANRRAAAVRRVRVSLQLAGMLGPAACLLVAVSPLAAGDAGTASAAVTVGLALSALSLGGVSASHLDVAPKHAGAVFGAGNTAATLAGLVATPLTGLVLRWTGGSWACVFGLVAAHYLAGSVAWARYAGDRPLPEDDDDDDDDDGVGGGGGGGGDDCALVPLRDAEAAPASLPSPRSASFAV